MNILAALANFRGFLLKMADSAKKINLQVETFIYSFLMKFCTRNSKMAIKNAENECSGCFGYFFRSVQATRHPPTKRLIED